MVILITSVRVSLCLVFRADLAEACYFFGSSQWSILGSTLWVIINNNYLNFGNGRDASMMKEKSYNLEDGIDALNEGKKSEARRLLAAAIREDPRNETAWLGMAQAVEEEERYVECMQRVLEINPENEQAKKVLQKYQASQKLSTLGEKLGRYGIVAVMALVVICIPVVLFSNTLSNLFSPKTPTPSRIPIEFTQTPSIQSTKTTIPTLTKTAVLPIITWTISPSPTREKEALDFFPCIPDSPPITVEVSKVLDGDTIEVILSGVTFLVGYIGVEAPNLESIYGEEAAKMNQSLVEGQEAWLFPDVSEWDENGRLMRYVFVGDMFVNYEILRLGYGGTVEMPPDTACSPLFEETVRGARNNSQGLWALIDLEEPIFTPTVEGGEP